MEQQSSVLLTLFSLMFSAAFAPVASALDFVAFLLLLLVSLSAPITKSIYLFRLSAHVTSGFSIFSANASGQVTFGLWGYCVSAIDVAVVGVDRSTHPECSKAHLGYTFDTTVAKALNAQAILNLVSRTTTSALVLHPIAAAFTFLTLLISLYALRRGSNDASPLPSILTKSIACLAAFLTSLAFLIDVILVAVLRKRVHDATHGDLNLAWGNAVWMTLGAAVALWFSLTKACYGVLPCGSTSRRQKTATY